MNKKRITTLSIGLFGAICGLVLSYTPNSFVMVKADDAEVIKAGYASTSSSATIDNCEFKMLSNSAPLAKYQPLHNDCVTLKRDGRVIKLSTNQSWDMISKTDPTSYVLDTSMLGTYAPQNGDVYTIKGQFVAHDSADIYTGKYILDISETSFVVSSDSSRSYFVALPQKCVDGGQASMPPEPDQQWAFLFNLNSLEQADAPVTGDDYAYYPTSTYDVFIDGKPVVKMDRQVLRRRDSYGYMFYVSTAAAYQGWVSLLNVGSVIVFDGTFIYKGDKTLPNNQQIGFSLKEVAFHKIGTKVNDYEVINLRQYLFDSINNSYDVGNYSGTAKTEVARILIDLENDIFEPETVKDVYKAYNDIVTSLDGYAVDPEAIEASLKLIREKAINEIEQYPNFDNYFPDEQAIINGYISSFKDEVQTKTSKIDIVNLVNQTKTKIDGVKVKKTVVTEAILNCSPGYEQYLCNYDRVSLADLNLETVTYYGDKEDLNTNPQENNIYNSFIPSNGNDKSNVIFQFKYQPHQKPTKGANVMAVLRGVPYRGYKIGIDTDTRGCFVEKISQDSGKFIGGTSFIFVNGGTYIVEVGAIDLLDYDLTWIFVRVDGEIRYAVVTESVGIAVNPRIALAPNDNSVDYNEDGMCVISNYDVDVNQSNTYCSAPKLSTDSVSDDKVIYCFSKENNVPYTSELSYEYYPASKDTVTLTRGLVSEGIANIMEPILAKVSETNYVVNVKDIDLQDGDVLTIQGQFSYFDSKSQHKVSFMMGKMVLTYSVSNKGWTQVSSLDDYKEDGKLQLEYFVNLNDYDEKVALAVSGVILKGKRLINECTSIEEVDNVVNEVTLKLSRFKTSFDSYKATIIKEVREYKNDQINDYRDDEKKDIEDLKNDAINNINLASSEEEVLEILDEFKQDVDELKTIAQYEKEELEEARRNGVKNIQNHYAALNIDKYAESKRKQVNEETLKAIQDLKDADSIDVINNIVKGYISSHPVSNSNNSGLITVIIVSSVVLVAGLGLLTFFLIRRRRKAL